MVIQTTKVVRKPFAGYFLRDNEVVSLWREAKRYGTKWQVILGFALFRGMRIGEIVAVNLYDFQNADFNQLNIILQKSYLTDNFPLLKDFNSLLKEYILKNKHLFKDGYLFPYHSSRQKRPHMTTAVAEAWFAKLRKQAGVKQPELLERYPLVRPDGSVYYNYRVRMHSCRHWFQTTLHKTQDVKTIADIMRYQDWRACQYYIDRYKVWENESSILETAFADFYQKLNNVSNGQMRLGEWI